MTMFLLFLTLFLRREKRQTQRMKLKVVSSGFASACWIFIKFIIISFVFWNSRRFEECQFLQSTFDESNEWDRGKPFIAFRLQLYLIDLNDSLIRNEEKTICLAWRKLESIQLQIKTSSNLQIKSSRSMARN